MYRKDEVIYAYVWNWSIRMLSHEKGNGWKKKNVLNLLFLKTFWKTVIMQSNSDITAAIKPAKQSRKVQCHIFVYWSK